MSGFDERIHSLLAAGEIGQDTTLAVRELGPEILGFLSGALGNDDRKREAARLRKRFQLVKQRLVARVRDAFAS